MLAFHNNPELKDEYLARVRAHVVIDEIIKGQCWHNMRSGGVFCNIYTGRYQDYEPWLGIPAQLACVEDRLFMNLPLEKAKLWPELFLSSIAVGADLSLVVSKFIVRVLGDSERGCNLHAGTPDSEVVINLVIKLYERKIAGDVVSAEEWELARCTAYEVAYDTPAAEDAAYAAATAANDAADATVVYAADAAADFDSGYNARVSHYEWMADVLIEELKNASVP